MDIQKLSQRALEVREKYAVLENKKYGKEWNNSQIMEGFVGDVGDLMKIVMAKECLRHMEDADEKLSHELSDCLWAILVLSKKFNIDIEEEFIKNMDALEIRIQKDIESDK